MTAWGFAFYLVLLAIVFSLVRPGSRSGEVMIAITDALAAVITTAEGQSRSTQ
jgi:hypothetical protein